MIAIGVALPARAQVVELGFDTLPSAQGWTDITSGPDESSVFSVDGTTLHQNSLGTGLGPDGTGFQYYILNNIVDSTQLFTVVVQARVLQSERLDTGGFAFGVFTGSEGFAIFMDTSTIQDALQTPIEPTIDTTALHEYRLDGTPGVGYEFFVDDILVASGPPAASDAPNQLFLGDATSGGNAQVDVTLYRFQQSARPAFTLASGDQQTGPPSSLLPDPLVVLLSDQSGTPVPGVPISFTITQQPAGATGAALTTTTTGTDQDGTASTQFTFGDIPGMYQVTASCMRCTTQSVTFTATANAQIKITATRMISDHELQVMTQRDFGTQTGHVTLAMTINSIDITVTGDRATNTTDPIDSQPFIVDLANYDGTGSSVPRFTANQLFTMNASARLDDGTSVAPDSHQVTILLPVVIVPGILQQAGGDGTYPGLEAALMQLSDGLLDSSLGEGYRLTRDDEPNYPTLYTLAYDTNHATFAEGAAHLSALIETTVHPKTWAQRVNLVTHSSGGLVARRFLTTLALPDTAVNNVIMCAPRVSA